MENFIFCAVLSNATGFHRSLVFISIAAWILWIHVSGVDSGQLWQRYTDFGNILFYPNSIIESWKLIIKISLKAN